MTANTQPIDLASLVAIDTHVHVEQDSSGCCSLDQELEIRVFAYYSSLVSQ